MYRSKENNMIIQYANEFIEKIGMGDPTTCVYRFIYDEKDSFDTYNLVQPKMSPTL